MSDHKLLPKPSSIKVAQSLIHIQHNISLNQYKIWLILLKYYQENFHTGQSFDENGFCLIPSAEIAANLNISQQSLQKMLDSLNAIRKETLILNYLNKDNMGVVRVTGFLSEFEIHEKTAMIGFKLPTIVHDVLLTDNLDLKQWFLLLNWSIFSSFHNKYEAIIYKLCKDFQGIGKTRVFDLEVLRIYFGLAKEQYPTFKEFNRKCIKVPVENLNAHEICDIHVDVEYHKRGRSGTGLRFLITPRAPEILEALPETEPEYDGPALQAFKDSRIAIPFDRQQKYLAKYSPEQIERIIARANAFCDQCKQQNKPVNIGGIYNKAFADNWGDSLELAPAVSSFTEWEQIPLNTYFRHENGDLWIKSDENSLFNEIRQIVLTPDNALKFIANGVLVAVDNPEKAKLEIRNSKEKNMPDPGNARALAILKRLNPEQRVEVGQEMLKQPFVPALKTIIKNNVKAGNLETIVKRFKETCPILEKFAYLIDESTEAAEMNADEAVTSQSEKRQKYLQMLKEGIITADEFELLVKGL